MAKPIILITVPYHDWVEASSSTTFENTTAQLVEILDDYHVLYAPEKTQTESIKVQVFNAINSTDIEIEELKNKITNEIIK